jgi:hypothetical protein
MTDPMVNMTDPAMGQQDPEWNRQQVAMALQAQRGLMPPGGTSVAGGLNTLLNSAMQGWNLGRQGPMPYAKPQIPQPDPVMGTGYPQMPGGQ